MTKSQKIAGNAGIVVGSLVIYAIIGNWIQVDRDPPRPEVFAIAKCQRAAIDERQGKPNPELLAECRRSGRLPNP